MIQYPQKEASLVAQLVKNLQLRKPLFDSLVWKIPSERIVAIHSSILRLPWWLRYKGIAYNVGNLGSIPGLGRCRGGGHGSPSSILVWKIPVKKGSWWSWWAHGQRSMGHKESDMTEQLSTHTYTKLAFVIIQMG